MTQRREHSKPAEFPGDVLVAACGFIVTGTAWGLFGYLDSEMATSSSEAVFYALALLHILVGIAVFARRASAVPAGALVALAGLVAAGTSPQYVLVFTNGVILLLLLLARANVSGRPKAA